MGRTASRRHRGRARPAGATLAYTIDGQGRVLAVQDAPPPDTALIRRADAAPPVNAADPRRPVDVGARAAPARLGRAGGPDRGRTA